MNDSEPFLHEITAAPDDDSPRLIFADWLDERGDPRAEFIRLQCELARQPVQWSRLESLERDLVHEDPGDLRIREADLLQQHEHTWLGEVAGRCSRWMFHRGFVEFVEITAPYFVRYGSQLFSQHPIRAAAILGISGFVTEVASRPFFSKLSGLSIGTNRMALSDFEQLLTSEHFPRLTKLIMIRNNLSDGHAAVLAKLDRLDRLKELDLTDNDIRNRGVAALVNSPTLANLKSLHFNMNSIRLLGARSIADSPFLLQLDYLDLRNNPIPRRGIDLVRERFGRSVCEA